MKKEMVIGSIVALVIGVLLIACSMMDSLEIYPFNLIFKGMSGGFISGFGGGLIGIGCVKILRYRKIKNNPELLKDFEITMHDERNLQIAEKAGNSTFRILILIMFISCISLIILQYSSVGIIIGFLLSGFCVLYKILYKIYQSKL